MTDKQRVHASLEGRPVDRYPVVALYNFLVFLDRFGDLTGLPQWRLHEWERGTPDYFLRLFETMIEQLPFEILQPMIAPTRKYRDSIEIVVRDGKPFCRHRKTGDLEPLPMETQSGHATEYAANETQFVFDRKDADEQMTPRKAEDVVRTGVNDYIDAAISRFGDDRFIVSGGVEGIIWKCHWHLGLTNTLCMMLDNPSLLDYVCKKALEMQIETIRRFAAAGGDAIYVDDAAATCDMISVEHYERFALPGMREMVKEIHDLGHKAILIYFGGVSDRLEQIASIGADGLLVEASMKSYVNDIETIVHTIGDRVTLFGNIDPIGVIQNGTDDEMRAEIQQQVAAGRSGRGFLVSPASPLTPGTPIDKIQRFIEMGRDEGSSF
ncbi:MAG: hypothetical protein HQ559_08240 [Lentisphaerae bacterium]|nr:hypothetical protein [Lentisphaerota bacterium]